MENSFSFLVFGKEIFELTIEDLKIYFREPKTESNKLEFKSAPTNEQSLKDGEKNILRAICAFLNSEGGILIWGSPIGIKIENQKEKVFKGDLSLVDHYYEKDAFISKIANKIIPSPKGILWHRIENNGSYAYIFEIPRSEYSPHQVDNNYYMRLDGQTVPAPHHYIEALFKKISFPLLEGYLRIDSYNHEGTRNAVLKCTIIFRNISRYQNDFTLHYRVISSLGKIADSSARMDYLNLDANLEKGSDYEIPKLVDVIYYGVYIYDSFQIVLSRDVLHQHGYEISLLITFGARYSPMKICEYKVKVGPNPPDNKQDMLIEKKENIFFHENEQSKNLSDAERLNKFLGRT